MMMTFQLGLLIHWRQEGKRKLISRRGRSRGLRESLLVLLKTRGSDPDDCATLTELMKKKALEDKKRKLDEQAAALLASKKAKLQKETPLAPSESEIDMGIFSGDRGNLLEEIFAASAPTCEAFVIVSSQVDHRTGLMFQKLLLLPLRHQGPLIGLLLVMILGRRKKVIR
ncbi:hypothetical protein Hdeb2414_s0010g00355631 [Helianthus debilis subsp. tardiflorus]